MMESTLVIIFFILNCLDLYSARQTCPPGTTMFMTKCVRCKERCLTCSSTRSSCITCQTGFILEDDKCVHCSKTCLGNCDSNAVCLGNCEEGYGGAYCNETCPYYCRACDKHDTELCTQCWGDFYGHRCLSGCVKGRYGTRCDYLCPPACLHSYCGQNEGTCVYGCEKGFTGLRCLPKINPTTRRITARDPSTVTYTTHDPSTTTYTTLDPSTTTYATHDLSTTTYTTHDPSTTTYATIDPSTTTPTTPDTTSSSTTSTFMSTIVGISMYPTSTEDIYDYLELTEAPVIPAGNQPEAEDDITEVDTDKAVLAGDSRHNVYVYVGLGIGLCVTLLIIAALAGYIVRRRNTISMNPPNVAPKVIYSHRSGNTNYSDSTRSQNQANAGYLEPNTEHTYDYISDDNHQESTPNTTTYDSNGYLQPSTITNRQVNPYQSYLTPIHVTVPSTDMQPSSYEPLKFEGITNNMYSGLHKPPDPAYESTF